MKTKHFLLAMGSLFFALYCAIHFTSRKPYEERMLEIYTGLETYYLDLDRLEIQTAGSDSVFFFHSFDALGFWLSEKTESDAVATINIGAYQDYIRCATQHPENDDKEWDCYQEYINKLTQ